MRESSLIEEIWCDQKNIKHSMKNKTMIDDVQKPTKIWSVILSVKIGCAQIRTNKQNKIHREQQRTLLKLLKPA